MKKVLIIEIICFLFILLFAYAAINKLMDVEKFRIQIGQSPLLTEYSGLVAWIIPVSEIAISMMLVVQRFRLIGLFGSFTLMVMFTAYITAILQFSEHIPCSCGGVLSSLGWIEHLIFNIGFVFLGLMGIILQTKTQNFEKGEINTGNSTVTN